MIVTIMSHTSHNMMVTVLSQGSHLIGLSHPCHLEKFKMNDLQQKVFHKIVSHFRFMVDPPALHYLIGHSCLIEPSYLADKFVTPLFCTVSMHAPHTTTS